MSIQKLPTIYKLNNILLLCGGLVISILFFYLKFGWEIINPNNNMWLIGYDYATQYIGWLFFKNEAWSFPLGGISNYFYPLGTNIGYTDSIPLMAIFGKLFRNYLSPDFQYLGLWLFLCFILQAFFAFLLLKRLDTSLFVKFLFMVFLIVSPILLNRYQHPALCAHWLMLWGIHIYLRVHKDTKLKSLIFELFFLNVFGAFIHPYIPPILLLVSFCVLLKPDYVKNRFYYFKALSIFSFLLFNVVFIWYVIGFFTLSGQTDYGAAGYGWFSTNLNALFNSNGISSFNFMTFKLYSDGQIFEGFNYLGLGLILLLFISIIFLIKYFEINKWRFFIKNHYLLFVSVLFMSLFAITHIVTFNDKVLFSFQLPHKLEVIFSPFRSSGRFFWLAYYVIMIAFFYGFSAFIRKYDFLKWFVLAALLIQLYDIKMLYARLYIENDSYAQTEKVQNWHALLAPFNHIVTYPPYEKDLNTQIDYVPFAYISAINKKTLTTGYLARFNSRLATAHKKLIEDDIKQHNFDAQTVYLTAIDNYSLFSDAVSKGILNVSIMDSLLIFYKTNVQTDLLQKYAFDDTNVNIDRFLADNKSHLILISVKDEATLNLKESTKKIFRNWGIDIDNLTYRGAFVAAIYDNEIVSYQIGNNDVAYLRFEKDKRINQLFFNKSIEVHSKGFEQGNLSSIIVDGIDYSSNLRGFNIAIFDSTMTFLKSQNFDTHKIY